MNGVDIGVNITCNPYYSCCIDAHIFFYRRTTDKLRIKYGQSVPLFLTVPFCFVPQKPLIECVVTK